MVAPNSELTIQNSTFRNVSCSNYGGAVYFQSKPNIQSNYSTDYIQSPNRSKKMLVLLRIINCSFSYTSSRNYGGSLCVFAENLLVIIHDSLFFRCSAAISGGVLLLSTNGNTEVTLRNNHFLENSADDERLYTQ